MLRSAARLLLIAALLVGVVAMHTFGHGEHHEAEPTHTAAATAAHHHAMPSGEPEEEPLPFEALFSVMFCGAVLLRLAFAVFHSPSWSRLITSALAVVAADADRRSDVGPPPPRLRPTGVALNRVAVLRI